MLETQLPGLCLFVLKHQASKRDSKLNCSSCTQSQKFCTIEFSSFKMKLLTAVPVSSPESLITPQAMKKKTNHQTTKRKHLLSNLTLFILVSDLLRCCTEHTFSLPPHSLPNGFAVSAAWKAIRILFASYKTSNTDPGTEMQLAIESKWKWFHTAAVVKLV